jgi:hypothetical protein
MDLERLQALCAPLLDDADVHVGLDALTGTVTFDFTANGSPERVIIRCWRAWRFRYAKEGDDTSGLFVGETHVCLIEGAEAVWEELKEDWMVLGEGVLPERLFRVWTEGGAMLDVLCEVLEWESVPAS